MNNEFLSPNNRIKGLPGVTIGDFWSWAYSDILMNTIRCVFAEFIVAHVLGALKEPRKEWVSYDLNYKGKKIEVKSSAYWQSWSSREPYKVKFDIDRSDSWDPETNITTPDNCRSADCYVFCLLAELDKEKVDVLDLGQWQFWIMTTQEIEEAFNIQQTVRLSRIKKYAHEVIYNEIPSTIERLVKI